jgi:hypothetical protein
MYPPPITTHNLALTKSRLDLGFVSQPRNRPPTSSCCSCHHATRTWSCSPPSPSNQAYLSSPHLETSPTMTFRACSSPAPTRVKPQPAPAILSQESVHTALSITHHTRKRPSTGPRMTHGPHQLIDEEVQKIIQKLSEGDPKFNCFRKDDYGVVWFGQRLVIHGIGT